MAAYTYDVDLQGNVADAAKSMASGITDLASSMTSLEGIANALDTAVAAVSVAILAATVAVLAWGAATALSATQAKAHWTALFDALGEGNVSGTAVLGLLDSLSGKLGMTREQLEPLAQTFMAMGITDLPRLKEALTAAASAQALMGESGASAYENLTKKIQLAIEGHEKLKLAARTQATAFEGMGVTLADVAKQMGISQETLAKQLASGTVDAKKFGDALNQALIEKGKGPLDQMAGSLSVLKDQFKANIAHLFEDVNTKPFIDGLKEIGSIFSQNTASGRVLKAVITAVFSGLFAVAGPILHAIKVGLLDIVIVGLKVATAIKPVARSFMEWAKAHGVLDDLKVAGKGLLVVIGGLAFVFAATAAVVLGFVAVVGIVAGAFAAMVGRFISLAPKAVAAVRGMVAGATQAAEDFIAGIVGGIESGVGAVVEACKQLAKSAIAGFKSALGISSPSKVMAVQGRFAAAGVAEGMRQGGDMVASSGRSVAGRARGSFEPPPARGAGARGGKGTGAGVTVHVHAGAVQITGAGRDAEDLTEEAVSLVFERIALEQGL